MSLSLSASLIPKIISELLIDFFKFVEEINPDGFLIENVESILHPTNKKAVDTIIRKTKKFNYNFKITCLNLIMVRFFNEISIF